MIGVLYGCISLSGGIAVFLLFVRIPSGLLYLLPPWLGRLVLDTAPWLVAPAGQGTWTGFLIQSLVALVFVVYGLWALHRALFGSPVSLPTGIRLGDKGGGD